MRDLVAHLRHFFTLLKSFNQDFPPPTAKNAKTNMNEGSLYIEIFIVQGKRTQTTEPGSLNQQQNVCRQKGKSTPHTSRDHNGNQTGALRFMGEVRTKRRFVSLSSLGPDVGQHGGLTNISWGSYSL